MICDECQALYEKVGDRAREADVFLKVRRCDEALNCEAQIEDPEVQAHYQVDVSEDHEVVWVGLYTSNRWLSESIEADLMAQKEAIEDLLEDELYERGFEARLPVEHKRDEQKVFVFRSPVFLAKNEALDDSAIVDRVTLVLLAYEATFCELGDMAFED